MVDCDNSVSTDSVGAVDFNKSSGVFSFARSDPDTRPANIYTYEVCAIAGISKEVKECFEFEINLVVPLESLSF